MIKVQIRLITINYLFINHEAFAKSLHDSLKFSNFVL